MFLKNSVVGYGCVTKSEFGKLQLKNLNPYVKVRASMKNGDYGKIIPGDNKMPCRA